MKQGEPSVNVRMSPKDWTWMYLEWAWASFKLDFMSSQSPSKF